MSSRSAPALLPAASLVGGVALVRQLSCVEPLLFAVLVASTLTLVASDGRWLRSGSRCLLWIALGMWLAAATWIVPRRQAPALPSAERAVTGEAVVAGHWTKGAYGWSTRGRLDVLRWGSVVDPSPRDITIDLPLELEPPPFGSRVRLRGLLMSSSGYANRIATPPGRPRLRVKSAAFIETASPPGRLARLANALRAPVDRALARARGGVGLAFTRALVLGDVSEIEPVWRRGLRRAGLSHLLAVSGLNVSMLAGLVVLVSFWLKPRARLLVASLAVVAYLLLVGPMPPIARAAAMGGLAIAALFLRRPPQAANSLAVVVLALVLWDPALVEDVSFQLTVAATGGLVLLAPALAGRWNALPRWLRVPLAATIAAQIATFPFVAVAFHQVSLSAPLLNLVAVPWAALTLAAAVGWVGLALVWPAGASTLVPALDAIAAPFTWPAHGPAGAYWLEPTVMGGGAALLAALLVVLVLWWPRHLLPLAGVGVLASALVMRDPARGEAGVSVTMLDVGQGDSLLLRDGERALLVDGGGWSDGDFGGRVLLPALAAEGVEELDAVLLSHADRDHCRGLVDLVDYLPVGELWVSNAASIEPCGAELGGRPGPRRRAIVRGYRAILGRWSLEVLSPDPEARGGANDLSSVILAEALGRRVLLTADIEAATELALVRRDRQALRADILKVAHHGSGTSTTGPFLAAVDPRLALISVGARNSYGHPNARVIDRLTAAGIATLRTDRDGAVVVRWRQGSPLLMEFPGRVRAIQD